MSLIEWSDDLLTGVEDMDKQHKVLVDMINHLYDLFESGRKEEAKEFFKKEMTLYLEKHFAEEEEFMKSIGYPDYETHRKAHEHFRGIMLDIIEKIDKGDDKELRAGISLAWGWLYSHIVKVDKKYGQFFKEKNS